MLLRLQGLADVMLGLYADAAMVTRHWRTSLLYLVPSIVYWLHNNVQFVTLKYVDPATYQIMGNLKIVTTGLLLWLCLRRQLSALQWMALALLMIGATTSQVLGATRLYICMHALRCASPTAALCIDKSGGASVRGHCLLFPKWTSDEFSIVLQLKTGCEGSSLFSSPATVRQS